MSKNKGFTLIELMVSVAVLAIVLSIAVPSFKNILLNNRLNTTKDELRTAIQLARSEAIKRKEDIILCRANADLTQCAADGTDWSQAWLLLHKAEVLKIWEFGQGIKVTGPATKMQFEGNGMLSDGYSFEIQASDCSNNMQHQITVNRIGSIKWKKASC